MDDLEPLQRAFDRVPINTTLGMKLLARGAAGAVVSLPFSSRFLQEGGRLHGGIVSTLADTAAVYAFYPELEQGELMTSIEFKLNFLRAAAPEGEALEARSKQVRRGRKVGVAEVGVWQGERRLAHGIFTYLFYREDQQA